MKAREILKEITTDKAIISNVQYIIDYLEEQFGTVTPAITITLQQIGTQLNIIKQMNEQLAGQSYTYILPNGLEKERPAFAILSKSNILLEKLISSLGITPRSAKQANIKLGEDKTLKRFDLRSYAK
jgi:phage terminase small subunit